jgi:hypothetical protein
VETRITDNGFWSFALERQAIWHRRFVQKLPMPWTRDPVLQRYKFTNCQRELDLGTQVLLQSLKSHLHHPDWCHVLNIFLYRAYNVPGIEWAHDQLEARRIVTERNERWENGEPIFTNAWMITGGNVSPADRLTAAVQLWQPEAIVEVAHSAHSLKTVFEAVRQQPFFGGMTVSWQVALDLTYIFKHLSDDEWIPEPNVLLSSKKGPQAIEHGPRAAAKLIAPELSALEVIQYLRDHQPAAWAAVAWPAKPRLSLADVEHTLCEFCKYIGIVQGKRTGRKFIPRGTNV